MELEQSSSIVIQIQNLQQQTNAVLQQTNATHTIALIGAGAAILSAFIAGFFVIWQICHRINHEKQWLFFQKNVTVLETATDLCWRMIYNKFILASYPQDQAAATRLFEVHKDVNYYESLMVLYGDLDLANKLAEMKDLIINTPNNSFLIEWPNLYKKGQEYLLAARKFIGSSLNENLDAYKKKLEAMPASSSPSVQNLQTVQSDTMGTIAIRRNFGQ